MVKPTSSAVLPAPLESGDPDIVVEDDLSHLDMEGCGGDLKEMSGVAEREILAAILREPTMGQTL
jgi:hypothetical protein